MHLMAEKMLRKRSDFVIYSYFKDSEFIAVKRDVEVHTLYVKGTHLPIEDTRKGYRYC